MLTVKSSKDIPAIETVEEGTMVEIIDGAGLFWGRFRACRCWTGERFWQEWLAS